MNGDNTPQEERAINKSFSPKPPIVKELKLLSVVYAIPDKENPVETVANNNRIIIVPPDSQYSVQ